MLFWIIAIALTIIALVAMVLPFGRKHAADQSRAALATALKAELAEIELDRGERFSDSAEADAARAEVARRLFALEREEQVSHTGGHVPGWAWSLLLIPVLAVPTYLYLGAPEYPDQPVAARLDLQPDPAMAGIEALVEKVERQLRATPDDALGWQVIAPVYVRLGRFEDASIAYANAVKYFNGPADKRSALLADHAELIISRANGAVPPGAKAILDEAIAADPENQKALFFNAIAIEQNGTPDEAKANWQALVDRFSGINPPWLEIARQRLGLPSVPAQPGPTAEDVAAAQDMAPEDRNEMINSMVARLAERLKAEPNDIAGWERLVRAYGVLNRLDDARQAVADANKAFAAGTPEAARIEALANELKL